MSEWWHYCKHENCSLFNQRTERSCGCHRTVEQMMQAEIDRLRAENDTSIARSAVL